MLEHRLKSDLPTGICEGGRRQEFNGDEGEGKENEKLTNVEGLLNANDHEVDGHLNAYDHEVDGHLNVDDHEEGG
jgi:hypothetical protein